MGRRVTSQAEDVEQRSNDGSRSILMKLAAKGLRSELLVEKVELRSGVHPSPSDLGRS